MYNSPNMVIMTIVTLIITPLLTTHEPPSGAQESDYGNHRGDGLRHLRLRRELPGS